MLGIIGAMEEEVTELLKLMDIEAEDKILSYTFYQGKMHGKDVIVLQGGIGKVNASLSTTLLLTKYNIDYVINIGTAGGIKESQNIGDVIISSSVVHHDVDVEGFGYEYGKIPGMPTMFKPDEDLLEKTKNILNLQHMHYHIGLIASGDQFVCRQDQVDNIKNHFPQAVCSEMEAASIAQVCYVFHTPFIITRSLSDIFNKGDSQVQFDTFVKTASAASAKMCYDLVAVI
ncbi:MAG: 5'-methylthioadenosine/adenosylhomocysteine nucleosidase [Erysipelotrichaceae bacterium]|nr:5'-methylthioadenosine/adenosylhomocysteine nucleosidase [Erysipelotrichaceae bacterium]